MTKQDWLTQQRQLGTQIRLLVRPVFPLIRCMSLDEGNAAVNGERLSRAVCVKDACAQQVFGLIIYDMDFRVVFFHQSKSDESESICTTKAC